MRNFFYPESVVVFGVSPAYDNFGRNIIKNLIDFDFQGKVYPVGRSEGAVYGMRIYRSVLEIEDKIDLAIFLTPAKTIPELLEGCGRKGIKRFIISSGGFSEFSSDKRELEEKIVEIVEKYDMRFIGPNCIAVINNDNGLCLPFVRLDKFVNGPIALLTQSGGVGLGYISLFSSENIGLNKYVSLGNKLNVSEVDLLPFVDAEDNINVICLYLEEMERGREFFDVLKNLKKPVIVFKSNVTSEGAKMAKSHTAALSNDDRIVSAAFKQSGVLRINEMNKMVDYAKVFTLPQMKGSNVAVISPTGGFAVILADLCEKYGFNLPSLPEQLTNDITSHVKAGVIKLANPLDLGDLFDMEMIILTVKRILEEPAFDALVLGWIYIRNSAVGFVNMNVFSMLRKLVEVYNKPIILCLIGDEKDISQMKSASVFPIFTGLENAVDALAALRDSKILLDVRNRKPAFVFIESAVKKEVAGIIKRSKGVLLPVSESFKILSLYGIPCVETAAAKNIDETINALNVGTGIDYPVAVKVSSIEIAHKSDVGGVVLNVNSQAALENAYKTIIEKCSKYAGIDKDLSIVIQPMITTGKELIIGVNYDKQFGPTIMLGAGGIYVEVLEDVTFRLIPIAEEDAQEMFEEIKISKILKGIRGEQPSDIASVINVLIKVSQLITDFPEIKELDINPIKVFSEGEGCLVLDARIVI